MATLNPGSKAGWYPDPDGEAPYRYYNGDRWTDRYRDSMPISPAGLTGLAASGALMIGAVGTWISVGIIHANGFDNGSDGKYTLAMGVVAAILAALYMTTRDTSWAKLAIVVGAIGVYVSIADVRDVQGRSAKFFGATIHPSVGWGLWLTVVAAVVLVLAGIAMVMERAAGRAARTTDLADEEDVVIRHPEDSDPWPDETTTP